MFGLVRGHLSGPWGHFWGGAGTFWVCLGSFERGVVTTGGGTGMLMDAGGATWGGAGRLRVPWGYRPPHRGPPHTPPTVSPPCVPPPPGWLWLRLAHLPPLRQVLPGGPTALLHGGFRHRRRHLPKGGSVFPPRMGMKRGVRGFPGGHGRGCAGPSPAPSIPPRVSHRPSPRTRWSDCPSTTSRRGGTTSPARRRGTGASPVPSPRTPPLTASLRMSSPPPPLGVPPRLSIAPWDPPTPPQGVPHHPGEGVFYAGVVF